MVNPTHPGESIRNCIDESDWTVTECAARLGVSRNNLSRLLNGRIGISARGCSGTRSRRLEQRGILDASASQLRPGARTPQAGSRVNGGGPV